MTTLRLEFKVRDFDMWREAFARDAGGRQEAGMLSYRIFRPLDDRNCVMLDADFYDADKAEGFLHILRTRVWPDPKKAPAKEGGADVRIAEMVESKEY